MNNIDKLKELLKNKSDQDGVIDLTQKEMMEHLDISSDKTIRELVKQLVKEQFIIKEKVGRNNIMKLTFNHYHSLNDVLDEAKQDLENQYLKLKNESRYNDIIITENDINQLVGNIIELYISRYSTNNEDEMILFADKLFDHIDMVIEKHQKKDGYCSLSFEEISHKLYQIAVEIYIDYNHLMYDNYMTKELPKVVIKKFQERYGKLSKGQYYKVSKQTDFAITKMIKMIKIVD